MKDYIFVALLFVLGALGLGHAYSKRSDCFDPQLVLFDAIEPHFSMTPFDIQKILHQEFEFLGSGNQSFAFVSQDGRYVLKLIKLHCFSLLNFLTQPEKRKEKLNRVFNGFDTALKKDAQHCALLFSQTQPITQTNLVSIKDKIGRKHLIDLASCAYAIQEKAIPTGTLLKKHLMQNEVAEAKDKICRLFEMYADELRQGIYDDDHNVIHNTGFVKNIPIRIDFGKLHNRDDITEALIQTELNKINRERIQPWLFKYFPELAPMICLHINNYLSQKCFFRLQEQ